MSASKISDYIEVAGKRLYYEIHFPELLKEGNPLLIFLHEGLGSVRQWKNFPESIGKELKCTVLVYDRYGYGKSEKLDELRDSNYLFNEAFIYLPELIEKLQINQKLFLIGHSDGGTIALLFASKYSDRILGLVTEADHLFCEDVTISGIKNAVIEYESGKIKLGLQKFHGNKTDSIFYGWADVWLAPENKDWNIEDYLPKITCPVLAIQGKEDCYGSERQLLSKKKNISGPVETLFIENCGHVPHFQSEELIKSSITNFFNKCLNRHN